MNTTYFTEHELNGFLLIAGIVKKSYMSTGVKWNKQDDTYMVYCSGFVIAEGLDDEQAHWLQHEIYKM